jgi:hypothetical protein
VEESGMDIFFCHNYLELKKIKFVVIVFNDYVIVL